MRLAIISMKINGVIDRSKHDTAANDNAAQLQIHIDSGNLVASHGSNGRDLAKIRRGGVECREVNAVARPAPASPSQEVAGD